MKIQQINTNLKYYSIEKIIIEDTLIIVETLALQKSENDYLTSLAYEIFEWLLISVYRMKIFTWIDNLINRFFLGNSLSI